jgi:hypothetical protein
VSSGCPAVRHILRIDPSLTILSPLVLTSDLLLFFGGEVVGDIECLSDLLGRLALDHVGDCLATNIKKGLDVKVVGSL